MKKFRPINICHETNIKSMTIHSKTEIWDEVIDFKKHLFEGYFTLYKSKFEYYSGSVDCLLRVGKFVYPVTFIANHDKLYMKFFMYGDCDEYMDSIPSGFEKRVLVLGKSIISSLMTDAIFEFGYKMPRSMQNMKVVNSLDPQIKHAGISYLKFDWKTLQLIQDQDTLKCLAAGYYPAIMPHSVVDKESTEASSGFLYHHLLTNDMQGYRDVRDGYRKAIDYESTLSMLVEVGAVYRKLLPIFSKPKMPN